MHMSPGWCLLLQVPIKTYMYTNNQSLLGTLGLPICNQQYVHTLLPVTDNCPT